MTASGARPRADIDAYLDPDNFARVMRGIRAFDAGLATRTRKALRGIAKPAIADVKSKLLEPVHGGGESVHRLRRTLAQSTKLTISTTSRGRAGVTISTTGAKLADPVLAALYNRPRFRHPVYERDGRPKVYVEQPGRPYFGAVLGRRRDEFRDAVVDVLEAAAAELDNVQ